MILSLFTTSLSFVRSTQILTLPFPLGTTTIGEHHSDGSVHRSITSSSISLSSSALARGSSGIDILLGVITLYGSAFCSILILYSPSSFPKPLNIDPNSADWIGSDVTFPMNLTTPRSAQASLPSNREPLGNTYISSVIV